MRVGLLQSSDDPLRCVPVQLLAQHNTNSNINNDSKNRFPAHDELVTRIMFTQIAHLTLIWEAMPWLAITSFRECL